MIEYRVQLFAGLREEVGRDVWLHETEQPLTAKELLKTFFNHFPNIDGLKDVTRLAVNQRFALDGAQSLTGEEEIALIPPVSGG